MCMVSVRVSGSEFRNVQNICFSFCCYPHKHVPTHHVLKCEVCKPVFCFKLVSLYCCSAITCTHVYLIKNCSEKYIRPGVECGAPGLYRNEDYTYTHETIMFVA